MFAWLKRLLGGGATAEPGSVSGPVFGAAAARAVLAALEAERQDAARRLADRSYWRDTGLHVTRAVQRCESVLLPLPDGGPDQDYYDRVLPALDAAVQYFRDDDADEDGYGVGTVHQINRELHRLAGRDY